MKIYDTCIESFDLRNEVAVTGSGREVLVRADAFLDARHCVVPRTLGVIISAVGMVFGGCGTLEEDDIDYSAYMSALEKGKWEWECREKNNGAKDCQKRGKDLMMIIKAKRRGNDISFDVEDKKVSIDFKIKGRRITDGPRWVNYDGEKNSSECPRLNCGDDTYLCMVAHDDPQKLKSPRKADLIKRRVKGGNSLHAWKGGKGGTAENDGKTKGGNNDMGVAFCIR